MRGEGPASCRSADRLNGGVGRPTSESGQSRRFDDVRATSALPLITDLRQKDRHVRFVPIPEVAALFDHLVGPGDDIWRDFETECLGGLKVYHEFEARRLFDW